MSVGAIRAGQAFVEMAVRNNKLIAGLNDASRRLKQFGASVAAIGRQMAMFGIGLAVPIGLATRRFMEFDDQMRLLRAVTEGTESEFQALVASARELGVVSGFTAVQIGALMVELGKAGLSRRQVEAATRSIANLARGTGEDVTIVSTIVGEAMRQFNLGAEQATRVADVLLVAANSSISSVESLGEALQYSGADAARFNLSIEDTLALLAALSNLGIQGSSAGTALRRLLTLTGTQAGQVRGLFGVESVDAAGNMRPLADILTEIDASLEGLGTAERSRRLFELFGFLGITAASGLGRGISNVRELQEALRNAEGEAARVAREMDAGLGGTWRRFRGAVESIAITIGESLAPELILLGDSIEEVAESIQRWIRANREIVILTGAAVSGVIALGGALVALGIAFKIAGFALGALGVVLGIVGGGLSLIAGLAMALLSPLTLVVAALAADVWINWNSHAEDAIRAVSHGISGIAETATTAFGGIMDAMNLGDLESAMTIATIGMEVAWLQFIDMIRNSWHSFTTWFRDTFVGGAIAVISEGLGNILSQIRGIYHELTGGLMVQEAEQAAILQGQQAVNTLVQRIRTHTLAGGRFEELPANIQALARFHNVHPGAVGGPNYAGSGSSVTAAPGGPASLPANPEIARLQAELAAAVADVAERRRWRDFEEMWAQAEFGGRRLAAAGRGAAAGLSQAMLGSQVTGTFSGAAASLIGVGSEVQRVNDEGVRAEVRGLRREVAEVGGIGVV